MATKIKLGSRPKTFKEFNVTVTLPSGEEGLIPITFKYRDRKEFGKWQDSLKNSVPQVSDDGFSWESFYGIAGELMANYLLDSIDSWGLDVPLNIDSLLEIESECGAAVLPAIMAAYGAACRDGRLGN